MSRYPNGKPVTLRPAPFVDDAKRLLRELNQKAPYHDPGKIKRLASELADHLRDDGVIYAALLVKMSQDARCSETEVALAFRVWGIKKVELHLANLIEGEDWDSQSAELRRALKGYIGENGNPLEIPYLEGEQYEMVDDELHALGGVTDYIGMDEAENRPSLSKDLTIKWIENKYPLEMIVLGVITIAKVRSDMAAAMKTAKHKPPGQTTIHNALSAIRPKLKTRGAGRAKKARGSEKRRNGKTAR